MLLIPCTFNNLFPFPVFIVVTNFFGQSLNFIITTGNSGTVLLAGGGTPTLVTIFNFDLGVGSSALFAPAHIKVPAPGQSQTNPVWNVSPTGPNNGLQPLAPNGQPIPVNPQQ